MGQHLSIKINRVGDPPTPLFPDGKMGLEADIHTAVILERGTQGGRPSVTFGIEVPGGKHYFAQMTAGLLEMLQGAIRGAEANWAENPK